MIIITTSKLTIFSDCDTAWLLPSNSKIWIFFLKTYVYNQPWVVTGWAGLEKVAQSRPLLYMYIFMENSYNIELEDNVNAASQPEIIKFQSHFDYYLDVEIRKLEIMWFISAVTFLKDKACMSVIVKLHQNHRSLIEPAKPQLINHQYRNKNEDSDACLTW